MAEDPRAAAIEAYKRSLLKLREADAKVRGLRSSTKTLRTEYDKTEDDLKALQVRRGAPNQSLWLIGGGNQRTALPCGPVLTHEHRDERLQIPSL